MLSKATRSACKAGIWSIDYTYILLLLVDTLERTFTSTSPRIMSTNSHDFMLKCSFKGWPPPRVVWFKDGKQIINGSQGFYHIEKSLSQCDHATLETTLHFPPAREEFEGYYACNAENSFNGWSSNRHSDRLQVLYECK